MKVQKCLVVCRTWYHLYSSPLTSDINKAFSSTQLDIFSFSDHSLWTLQMVVCENPSRSAVFEILRPARLAPTTSDTEASKLVSKKRNISHRSAVSELDSFCQKHVIYDAWSFIHLKTMWLLQYLLQTKRTSGTISFTLYYIVML